MNSLDQGICTDNGCKCYKGFSGKDCSLKVCPIGLIYNITNVFKNDSNILNSDSMNKKRFEYETNENITTYCSGNGNCDFNTGKCICPLGFKGNACEEKYCHNNCYENGYCSLGECHCKENYYGRFCEYSKLILILFRKM